MSSVKPNKIKKLLFILAVCLIGSGILGFVLGLLVISLYQNFIISVMLSVLIFPFYFWSIWKQLRNRKWLVIVRKLIEIYLISSFLTAMFSFEDSSFSFGEFEWTIIYICIAAATIIFSFFMIISEYFHESRIYKETEHLIKGMQIYGLIPGGENE